MVDEHHLLTVTQVAEVLNVSRAEAYLLVRQRGFPLIELGPHMLRVQPRDLENWLSQKVN